MRSLSARVLEGLSEAVVVTGAERPGGTRQIVHAINPAGERLLPGLAAGAPVEHGGHDAFTAVVRGGAEEFEAEVGGRSLVGRGQPLADDSRSGDLLTCWYLRDVTDERRGSRSLHRAQARAQFLAEAGRALHGVLNVERTLRTAATLAAGTLAPTVLVLLADASETVRWVRGEEGARPVPGEIARADLRSAPRLFEAMTGDSPVDPWAAVELADLPVWSAGPPTGHVTVVPVPGTVVRGALVLVTETPLPPDVEDGLPLAQEYAVRVGTALSAAALYREQAHLGEVLQGSLEPPRLPEAVDGLVLGSAYRPARESLRVGGDFYEVLPVTPSGETPFLLGDVCGKGIEAAVLSGRVRQSLHALRLVERDPAALLDLLNAALLDAADLDAAGAAPTMPRFATMVLGDARPTPDGSVRLRLATGGHPPPYVLRADGSVVEVRLSGTLVGALRDGEFGATEVLLRPGDTCLLYSDGVTEARGGPDGRDFYGEERLEGALASCVGAPAQVVCERVLQLLSAWLGGRDHDDVALLALQAPPAVPRGDHA
ncbi:serine/threonine-protein phosphatase [Actinomycetospora endophytica]|uniref:Serine/threonine-protein phosphatase n=1 Tax=Actinomycetospora endophytica TaxID=2291215 RepID=A0ABS8PCL1_9PSEU|nr:PP2C family protein-serine/threonine phosphatase [Actinomycetospora endophytica]MCD2196015.1 serine/threonine-protein phosphatase [Actinomycetospora endophytica]